MARLIVTQFHDGVKTDEREVPLKQGVRNIEDMMEVKLESAENKGWTIERTNDGFHAWKEYSDGDGTIGRPNRKDRYFKLVK